jgi:hypothetical protein
MPLTVTPGADNRARLPEERNWRSVKLRAVSHGVPTFSGRRGGQCGTDQGWELQ